MALPKFQDFLYPFLKTLHTFAGTLDEKKANKGIFITTSWFTSEARKFAEEQARKSCL